MNAKNISAISKQVSHKFPELSGARPKITQQKAAHSSNFLLTYSGKAKGPGGHVINRRVRVVANEQGKIIKISTSR